MYLYPVKSHFVAKQDANNSVLDSLCCYALLGKILMHTILYQFYLFQLSSIDHMLNCKEPTNLLFFWLLAVVCMRTQEQKLHVYVRITNFPSLNNDLKLQIYSIDWYVTMDHSSQFPEAFLFFYSIWFSLQLLIT